MNEKSSPLRNPTPADEEASDGDQDSNGVPYDRGWAWMVLVGSVVNYGLISAYNKTMGVFFVELLHHFRAPASQTALLFAIKGGVLSVAGMFIMNAVIGRLGCRKTALIGAVLMSLSAILSSLADNLILLICLQAVLLGVSDCMLGSTGEVLTARYFRKRRALAMGVIKASSSLGSTAYPPLLAHLVSAYGLRGALLLTGALSLHSLPAALLLRPTSFFSRRTCKGEGLSERSQSDRIKIPNPPPRLEMDSGKDSCENSLDETFRVHHHDGRSNPEVDPKGSSTGKSSDRSFSVHWHKDRGTSEIDQDGSSIGKSAGEPFCVHQTEVRHDFKTGKEDLRERTPITETFCLHKTCNHHQYLETRTETESEELEEELVTGVMNNARLSKEESLKRALLSELEAKFRSETNVKEKGKESFENPRFREKNEVCASNTEEVERLLGSEVEHTTLAQKDVPVVSKSTQLNCPISDGEMAIKEGKLQRLKSALCVLDFSLFRRPSFSLLFLYYMFSPNINVGLDYLPALAEEQGMTKAQASHLLSIIGGIDLLSRLSAGLLTNLEIVPVPVLAGVALTGLGGVYQCTRWLTSFGLLIGLAVAQGVLAGVVNGVTSLLILHVVGVTGLAKGIGFQLLAEGGFSSAFHPLMGYVRDRTGSYVMVYHVTGCCLLAAAVLLLCEELVRKREDRLRGDDPS